MAGSMDIDPMDIDPPLCPPEYTFTPLRALRVAARKKLAGFLDLDGSLVLCGDSDVVNDWSGLAELAGFSYQEIMNMKRQKSPTLELLDKWISPTSAYVGKLWGFLYMMEREDILTDCRRAIVNDCRLWAEQEEIAQAANEFAMEQDPTVSTSEMKVDETKISSIQDIQTGKKTMYDAFICYTPEDENDRKFVREEIIEELEKKRNLKLFIPGRDDIPGSAEYTITAYLIEVRCRRVVILMSKKFLQSQVCDFQVKFAHALAPGARSKKLIPILREKNIQMPRILRFLAVCDFTKSDMKDWVWDRLYAAIIAPIGPVTYFEPEDPYNPFQNEELLSLKDIQFPNHQRLSDTSDVELSQERVPEEREVPTSDWNQRTSALSTGTSMESSTSKYNGPSRPPPPAPERPRKQRGMSLFNRSRKATKNSEISSTQNSDIAPDFV